MIEHAWSVLCDRPILDKRTDKVSLVDCVDQLWILDESFASHGEKEGSGAETSLIVVTLWFRSDEREEETHLSRLSIQTPSGKEILSENQDTEVRFPKGFLRNRTFAQLSVIPLRGPGHYRFLIKLQQPNGRWKTCAKLPLLVNFGKPEVKPSSSPVSPPTEPVQPS